MIQKDNEKVLAKDSQTRNKKVIVITGTPGTGKTTLSKKLGERGFFVINLKDYIEKNNLIAEVDDDGTLVVDEERFTVHLRKFLKSLEVDAPVIIEGHFGELVPSELVDTCIVLRTDLAELRRRLELRNYSEEKINENLEAEIMRICWENAVIAFGEEKVHVLDSSKGISKMVDAVIKIIKEE